MWLRSSLYGVEMALKQCPSSSKAGQEPFSGDAHHLSALPGLVVRRECLRVMCQPQLRQGGDSALATSRVHGPHVDDATGIAA